jgi:hypothetical protein
LERRCFLDNTTIAKKLFERAAELESHGHSLHRVRAYRKAAGLVKMLPCAVADLVREGGRQALLNLPGVGAHLAYVLEKLVTEGQLRTLGPTPEQNDPRERLLSLPGVGDRLAERMQEELGIDTIEELKEAAVEGRLEQLDLPPRRLSGIHRAIAARRKEKQKPQPLPCEPSIADLLAVDEEFRALLAAQPGGRLGVVGTPVLRTRRGQWRFQATLSQSPLAYRLDQAGDWVEVHFDNGKETGERIIVTASSHGQRVVRGRECECQPSRAS